MEAFITALTTSVNGVALWGAIEDCAGLIAIAVLFAFGFRMVKKIVKGLSRGKASL